MKRLPIILGIAGVVLAVLLVVGLGAGKIARAVSSVGWDGFGLIVGWQLLLFFVLAGAWLLLCPEAGLWRLVWGRLVREGGTNILPFSEFGGLAFGARAVTLAGVPWPKAIASTIADVSAEFIGELPFILFGFLMLVRLRPGSSLILPLVIGLGVIAAAAAALVWAERHSAKLFHTVGRRIATQWLHKAARQADEVQDEFDRLFSAPRRLLAASGLHFAGWVGGGVTVWFTYHLLGAKIDLLAALTLEGLLSCALAVAFLVPDGLGVQEASYIALGRLFGMPASLSLSLSLLRRARDIVIGAPAVLAWQALEVRRLRLDRARSD